MSTQPYRECPVCVEYADRRRSVLGPAVAEHCFRTEEPVAETIDRYMTGVHQRHLAGLSLAVPA